MRRTTLAVAACFLTAPAWGGQDAYEFKSLTVGDQAPAIEVGHWLKGEPVEAFDAGHVYVVEFWATWCGPCRASVPHITELQEKYKDYQVHFVGISDEQLPIVVEFMSKADSEEKLWFHKMGYTVATDPDRSAYMDYMLAAGMTGIPTAFIVGKDGIVEWIGHPMRIDDALDAVVKDAWDRNEFRDQWEEKMAEKRARVRPRYQLEKAKAQKNWKAALGAVDEMIAANEDAPGYKITKFLLLVRDMNEPQKGYAFGREVVKDNWDTANLLNQIAWYTVDTKGIKTRDLEFAMKAAMRANELTDGEDAAILDTVARVHYEKGDLKGAVKWQRKAVEHAEEGSGMARELSEVLIKYEREAKTRAGG